VDLVAASSRVIGTHERLYDPVVGGAPPDPSSDQASCALVERTEAHVGWRAANARAQILIPDNRSLHDGIDRINHRRGSSTVSIREYQRLGPSFDLGPHDDAQRTAWEEMRRGRYDLIAAAQAIAVRYARWRPVPRKRHIEETYGSQTIPP